MASPRQSPRGSNPMKSPRQMEGKKTWQATRTSWVDEEAAGIVEDGSGETFMFKPTAGAPKSGTCGDPILEACAAADRAPAKAVPLTDAPADDEARSPSSSTPAVEEAEGTSVETKTEASPVKDLRWEGRREGGRSRRRGPAALQGGACEGQGLAGEGGDGNGEEGQGKMGEEEDTGAQGEQGFGQKRALTGSGDVLKVDVDISSLRSSPDSGSGIAVYAAGKSPALSSDSSSAPTVDARSEYNKTVPTPSLGVETGRSHGSLVSPPTTPNSNYGQGQAGKIKVFGAKEDVEGTEHTLPGCLGASPGGPPSKGAAAGRAEYNQTISTPSMRGHGNNDSPKKQAFPDGDEEGDDEDGADADELDSGSHGGNEIKVHRKTGSSQHVSLAASAQARASYNKTVTTPSMHEDGNSGGNKGYFTDEALPDQPNFDAEPERRQGEGASEDATERRAEEVLELLSPASRSPLEVGGEEFPSLDSSKTSLLGAGMQGLPQRERKGKKDKKDSDYKWQLEKQEELQRQLKEREEMAKLQAAPQTAPASDASSETSLSVPGARPADERGEGRAAGGGESIVTESKGQEGTWGDGRWGPDDVYTPAPSLHRRVSDLKSSQFGADAGATPTAAVPAPAAAPSFLPPAASAGTDAEGEDFSEIQDMHEGAPAVNTKGLPMSRWSAEKSKRIAAVASGPMGASFAGRGSGAPAQTVVATGPLYSDGVVSHGTRTASPARVFASTARTAPTATRAAPPEAGRGVSLLGSGSSSAPAPDVVQPSPATVGGAEGQVQQNGAGPHGDPSNRLNGQRFSSPEKARYSSPTHRYASPGKGSAAFNGRDNGRVSALGNFSSAAIPRDHRRFTPAGWMQQEFSSVSNIELSKSTKEEVRRLELAWQMRIDLDTREMQRLESQLMAHQEELGKCSATLARTSGDLRQQFDLIAPLQKKLRAYVDELAALKTQRAGLLEQNKAARQGPKVDVRGVKVDRNRELASLAQYGTPEDADRMIRQIEEDFETTVAGADSKFNMLQDKPNISSMGLWKVTNDQTALLRAERETTRRVAEINKLRPLLETHVQHKDGIKEQLDRIGDKSRTIESDITAVRNAMRHINVEIEALKKTEAARRAEYDKVAQQRNMMRETISNLQIDLRAEKAERNKQRERYRFLVAQEREFQLRHEIRQGQMSGMHEAMLQAHRDELEEASMAREEAEAHARMLQASISRYDRLKKEVESWSADPSSMQRGTQPLQPSQSEADSGAGGQGGVREMQDGRENSSAAGVQVGTWGVGAEETSWVLGGDVAQNVSGAAKDSEEELDLGEAVGIPKQGWQPEKRTPGQEIMKMLRAVPSAVVATVTSAVAGSALGSKSQPTAEEVEEQVKGSAKTQVASEIAPTLAKPQILKATPSQVETDEADGVSALDREIEMELEAKLQSFRQEMEAVRQAQIREAQRKERARQKAAAKKELEQDQKKVQQSLYESDGEQEMGQGDPNFIDWMHVSDDQGVRRHEGGSRSKSRGRIDRPRRHAADDSTKEGGGSALKDKAPRTPAMTPRGRRGGDGDKKELEENEAAQAQPAPSTPERAKPKHGETKKGKAKRRLNAKSRGGGDSEGDSDGEGLGSRDKTELAAAAKQAATAMSRRKEVARKREKQIWYGVLMFVAIAAIGWMVWASLDTPVPLKGPRKGPRIGSPDVDLGGPGGMPGRAPTGPPAPKGKKEITRVMIKAEDSGIEIPMIIYHRDPAGVESDVDRFLKHFQIPAEQYRDQLLQVAFGNIDAMSGGGAGSRAMPRTMQPMGHTSNTQHGNRFGDDDDDDEEEEEDGDALEQSEQEDEEEEEWDPDAQPQVHSKQPNKQAPLPPKTSVRVPPAPTPQGATSHGDDDEEWAEEDEDHPMLPKTPPTKPPQTRGEKLFHLSLKVPQQGGKAINVQFDVHAHDDRKLLEKEAAAFVSLHSLPAKDTERLVQAALQKLDKHRKK